MAAPTPLSPDALFRRCDPERFSFETTEELAPLKTIVGQDRAVQAVRFGIGIQNHGYNLFALGTPGVGKHSVVIRFLRNQARHKPAPQDLCYVNNFQEPNQPRAMALPTGRGAAFKSDMANLIEVLRHAIPSAFESEDYRSRRHALEEEFRSRHEAGLEAVQKEAQENQIAVLRTPMGLALAPVRNDEVVSPEDFQKLPAAEQTNIREKMNRLQEKLEVVLSNAPRWEREARTRLKELNRGVTNLAVGHLIDDLRGAYADIPVVQGYLDAARQDLIENVEEFLNPEAPRPEEAAAKAMAGAAGGLPTAFRRYQVNLMISHPADSGAPVVYEDNPNLQSLLGRIEHIAQFGALMTDFSQIGRAHV